MFIHFLLAMLPIIWLIIALSGLKMAGHVACPIALIITAVEALFLWKQKIIDVLTGGLEDLQWQSGQSVWLSWQQCLLTTWSYIRKTWNLSKRC